MLLRKHRISEVCLKLITHFIKILKCVQSSTLFELYLELKNIQTSNKSFENPSKIILNFNKIVKMRYFRKSAIFLKYTFFLKKCFILESCQKFIGFIAKIQNFSLCSKGFIARGNAFSLVKFIFIRKTGF